MAARDRLYRALMGSDHEAEIRASVGAHQDLGPSYDDAVAEGLVERIGAEIDKRIDAQLRRYGMPFGPQLGPPAPAPGASGTPMSPGSAEPAEPAAPQAYPAPAGYQPGGYPGYPGYPGYQGFQAPMLAPGYQAVPGVRPTSRSVGQRSVAMTFIALGSMALGVAATAIVAHERGGGGQALMVLLIWAAIVIVNVAYARRC